MDDSSVSLFPSPPIQISDDQFHAFHLSDRKLYQVLVDDLERDPSESMNVMAFWIWLEREVCVRVNLIHKLVDLPYNLVNEVADETVICLLCCQFENLPFSGTVYELAVLPNLAHPNVATKKVALQDFHYNRACVILNVNKIVKDVCFRAFKDLVPKKPCGGFLYPSGQTNIFRDKGKGVVETSGNVERFPKPVYGLPVCQPPTGGILFGQMAAPGGAVNTQQVFPGFPVAHARKPQLYDPISNILGLGLSVIKEEEDDNVLPEERTIFITFSKGYPVSEAEVRDFFSRKFGDFIEAIYMQEVPPNEQALYARIVARSAAIVDLVVQGGRAKYSIFGKHVWARKYVKKF